LPLIVTAALMPGIAYAMTQFVLVPQLKKSLGLSPASAITVKAKEAKPGPETKLESVQMNKLLVNVAGTMGARYLLVSLSVAGSDQDFKGKVAARDPQMRDFACGVLATKTIADLEKPGARNVIRSELISGFNNILGGALVQEIYLTEFAIQ
jgi:flagellar FliL protein